MKLKVKPTSKWNRMIEITLRFNSVGVKNKKGIKKKHCLDTGTVEIKQKQNKRHNINSKKATHFNSLLELPRAIEKVLINNRIKVHPTSILKKYLAS